MYSATAYYGAQTNPLVSGPGADYLSSGIAPVYPTHGYVPVMPPQQHIAPSMAPQQMVQAPLAGPAPALMAAPAAASMAPPPMVSMAPPAMVPISQHLSQPMTHNISQPLGQPMAAVAPAVSQPVVQPVPAPAPAADPANAGFPATGGVSAVLDYEMDQMVKFVSWLCFGLMKRQDNPTPQFHQRVRSVLSATRLPKSTIILALLFLSDRMELVQPSALPIEDNSVFETLVVGLVLSNKFNDDNTFRNKSWSDATGLPVHLINHLEAKWLSAVGWRLHHQEGFSCIEECWQTWCDKFAQRQALQPQTVVGANASVNDLAAGYASYVSSPSSESSIFSQENQFSPSHTPLDLSSPLWDPNYQMWKDQQQQQQTQQQQPQQQQPYYYYPYYAAPAPAC